MADKIRANIWRVLKRGVPVTPEDVVREVGRIDKKEVCRILDSFVKKGYIKKTNGTYLISQNLDPPVVETENMWDYSKVTSVIPRKYKNDNIYFLARRDQDGRGTCVGQATVYGRDIDWIRLTGSKPTEEELANIQRNKKNIVGNCVVVTDILPKDCFSAECAYQWSREEGNIVSGSGSNLIYAVKALKKRGIVFEDEWWTSKTNACVLKNQYPGTDKTAKDHVIDGYAECKTFEDVCKAIYTHGYIYGGILIYENYTYEGRGMFPDPKGDVIGAHALCWVGYDMDKQELYCIHSWLEWDFEGGISRKYFETSATNFIAVLDSTEVAIVKEQYCKVNFKSNYSAAWFYGSNIYEGRNINITMEKGKESFVTCIADNSEWFENPYQEIYIKPETDMEYMVIFKRKNLFKYILDKIRGKVYK